jgi:hypothetical protein
LSEEQVGKRERMAITVREVIARRERAPRSPRMERAIKRLIWRYTLVEPMGQENGNAEE